MSPHCVWNCESGFPVDTPIKLCFLRVSYLSPISLILSPARRTIWQRKVFILSRHQSRILLIFQHLSFPKILGSSPVLLSDTNYSSLHNRFLLISVSMQGLGPLDCFTPQRLCGFPDYPPAFNLIPIWYKICY